MSIQAEKGLERNIALFDTIKMNIQDGQKLSSERGFVTAHPFRIDPPAIQ